MGVVVGRGGRQRVRVRVRCWWVLSDNGRGEVLCLLSKAVGAGCGLSGFISEGRVCVGSPLSLSGDGRV